MYKPPATIKPPHTKSLNQAIFISESAAHRLFEAPTGTRPIYSITHQAPDQSLACNDCPTRLLLVQYPLTIPSRAPVALVGASKPLAAVRLLQQHTLLSLPVEGSLWLPGATLFCR